MPQPVNTTKKPAPPQDMRPPKPDAVQKRDTAAPAAGKIQTDDIILLIIIVVLLFNDCDDKLLLMALAYIFFAIILIDVITKILR